MKRKLINEEEIAQMIIDCSKRDPKALERLYVKVACLLNHFAMGIVHNEALSNEILQDSFIQIWENAHNFEPSKGKAMSWMRAIVRNKAIDKLRTESKHLRTRHINNSEIIAELPAEQIYQPDIALSENQLSRFINANVESLPSNQRMSILLAYFHGYTRNELAVAMNTNINTTKSWLRRGLKTMKYQHIKT